MIVVTDAAAGAALRPWPCPVRRIWRLEATVVPRGRERLARLDLWLGPVRRAFLGLVCAFITGGAVLATRDRLGVGEGLCRGEDGCGRSGHFVAVLPEVSLLPRLWLNFPPFDYTDGLDASGNFISAAGTLFPIALCGLSSL